MANWITTQAKQQWQKLAFSIGAALFFWWYVHETLVTTRVFTDVPIYIQGLPAGKTLGGLRKDGRLMRQFSITLKGRKKALDAIKPDQIEVLINAIGKGDVWKEELAVNSLRCLNNDVQVLRDVTEVTHPPLQIRLTSKASRDIPINILPPSGNLPKGYKCIDVWPDHLTQTVEGPEEAVQALMVRRLFLTFDLNRVTKTQLERTAEDLPPGSEIFFKVPESWKYIDLPAPFGESRPLQDPEAEHLMLVILKPALLPLEAHIPIRISHLPIPLTTSPHDNRKLEIVSDNVAITMEEGLPHWTQSVFIDGVSREFLQVIVPHLELVIYVGTRGNISALFEIANAPRAVNKYVHRMMQTHFERSTEDEALQARLTKQFWYYFSQMSFYGHHRQRISWDFTIEGKQLRMREAD